MDRRTASQWACPAASCGVRQGPSPSPRSEHDPILTLSRGETLILVLILSLGFWALIWAGVSLFGAYG
jgi:hypothetical protein